MKEQPTPAPPTRPHQLPIGQVLAILWRGRWIILITALTFLVLGILYVNDRGTIWRASSRLYVERHGMTIPGFENVMMAGARSHANTQAEVLRSGKVLSDALQSPNIRDSALLAEVESRIAWLKRAINVSVGHDNDIITVSLESTKVADACDIVNEVVDAYIAFHSSKTRSTTDRHLKKLTNQLDDYKADLERDREKQKGFLKESPELGGTGTGDFEYLLRELNTALAQAKLREFQTQNNWSEAKELATAPKMLRLILQIEGKVSVDVAQNRTRQELSDQLRNLASRRHGLEVQVKAEHGALTLLDAEIAEVKKQLRELELEATRRDEILANFSVANLDRIRKRAQQDVVDLKARVGEQEKQYQALGIRRADYLNLEADLKRTQSTITECESYLNRLKFLRVDQEKDKDLLSIQVIDLANPNKAEITSSYARVIATYLLLGLVLGFGLAWLRGIFDQRLRNAEDVSEGLDISLLVTMPRTPTVATEVDAIQSWDDNSALAESARSLRTAVYFGLPDGMGRIIQITSPESGDGKSLVTSKLAIAMAMAGQKTLLLDADLRRPTQASLFQLDKEKGLSSVLATGAEAKKMIQSTRLENLDVLTSGPVPANPAEILNSPKFEELLQQLGDRYERIIVDSPPLLPVADSRIIATKCDTTLLVFRVDKSTRKRAAAARDSVLSVGGSILGCVLNDMPRGIGYGYGGYYDGRYGYGYGGYGDEKANGRKRRRRPSAKVDQKSPAQPEEIT